MTETLKAYERLKEIAALPYPNPLPSWWQQYNTIYWQYLYSPVSSEYRRKEAVDQSGERR